MKKIADWFSIFELFSFARRHLFFFLNIFSLGISSIKQANGEINYFDGLSEKTTATMLISLLLGLARWELMVSHDLK